MPLDVFQRRQRSRDGVETSKAVADADRFPSTLSETCCPRWSSDTALGASHNCALQMQAHIRPRAPPKTEWKSAHLLEEEVQLQAERLLDDVAAVE